MKETDKNHINLELFIDGRFVHTYPKPVPFLPGLVRKFLPDDLADFPGFDWGLNALTGPPNVP